MVYTHFKANFVCTQCLYTNSQIWILTVFIHTLRMKSMQCFIHEEHYLCACSWTVLLKKYPK